MDPSINQFQPAYDEEADPKAEALLKKAESSDETFFSFYHRHQQFDQQANGSMSEESNHRKINLLQESSNFSQQSKPKRRKTETVDELHKGRIVRSSGRKDRHSKVCTSRGPKDRRVRLSPGTAIQFYDVQDRLGYDRPSKAIDWLMKEAKSAIDALDAAENHSSVNGKTPQMQNNSENSISGFCDFDYELFPSPSTEFRAWPDGDLNPSRKRNQSLEDDFLSYPSYQDGVLTAFTYPSQIFDTNLQRIIANSEYSVMNTLPLQFTGPPVLGPNQIFTQREPLQSSFVNYCPIVNEFQGISFYGDEFSNVTPAETLKEKDKIPVVSSKHCFKYKED